MIDGISSFLFAPTKNNEKTLLSENIDPKKIFVTGNTVVDALLEMRKRIDNCENLRKNIYENIKKAGYSFSENKKTVLVTTHRRENIGNNLVEIYEAIKILAQNRSDYDFLLVLHPNPVLWQIIEPIISSVPNIKILRDVDYYSFMFLMSKAYIIMTDSGGIQEEAPSFNVPVFVLRNETERPEGIDSGVAKILGADRNYIVSQVSEILDNPDARTLMSGKENPYGDGKASLRIANVLEDRE
jgi:UDP-N-acetylglucosamine 2-epimerase (non-hydrolysing)